jgi:hypothetical protein
MELFEQLARAGWKVSVRHNGHEFVVTISRARCPLVEDDVRTYKGADLPTLVAVAHGGAPGGIYG